MIVAASALRARAAYGEQLERNAIALREAIHAIAQRLDLARYFMPETEARGQRKLAAIEVQIAAADADASYPHERFARCRLRHVHVGNLETAPTCEQRCFHRMPPAAADLTIVDAPL